MAVLRSACCRNLICVTKCLPRYTRYARWMDVAASLRSRAWWGSHGGRRQRERGREGDAKGSEKEAAGEGGRRQGE